MALRLLIPCLMPYCRQPAERNGYCLEHAGLVDERRLSRQLRGYDETWRRFRLHYLARHPLCESCRGSGEVRVATEIHHKQPLLDFPELKFIESNLMALCKSCHARLNGKVRAIADRQSSD